MAGQQGALLRRRTGVSAKDLHGACMCTQWRGYSDLAVRVEERVVELLEAAGQFPKPPPPCLV